MNTSGAEKGKRGAAGGDWQNGGRRDAVLGNDTEEERPQADSGKDAG